MGDRRKRSRVVFEADEVVRRAIRMRAGLEGVKPTAVINAALEAYLAKEIPLAREYLATEGQKARKRKDDHGED